MGEDTRKPITKDFYDKEYFSDTNTKSAFPGGYQDNVEFSLFAFDLNSKFRPTSSFELGCAKGFVVDKLRGYAIDAMGTDISEYATQGKPYLVAGDATEVIFPEVDLIYSKDFFEHLTESQIKVIMDKCKVAKRYNYHVITIGDQDYGDASKMCSDTSHISIYTAEWWFHKFVEAYPGYRINISTQNTLRRDGQIWTGEIEVTIRK